MKRYSIKHLLLIIALTLPFVSSAQLLKCTTHEKTNEILDQHPEKRALLDQLNREAQEYTNDHYGERATELKIIPVVFHVIHDYGSENLSKESIVNSLERVNEELRGQNGNLSSVIPEFESIIADTEFELRLARIDENGNCTDGITRTVSNRTYTADEDVKDLINWNDGSRRYLQVWIVNTLSSGAGGYTYLPGSVSTRRNGIIVRSAQLGGSLAHEFGHWLNLSHTWGGGNDNGVSCGNDGVSDTPQTIGSLQECNTNQMSCGSLDNVQNHMDYSTCARMFTLGQKARMHSASDSNTGGRSTYWGSSNRSATGTNDGFTNVCVPIVEFGIDNGNGCEGLEVEFEDLSWNADIDGSWIWSWTFEGGTPATSNEQNPSVTYNTAGVFDVALTVQNSAGSVSETMQNLITVNSATGGIAAPFLEGAENSDFPDNSDPELEWTVETPGGVTWSRSTSASYSGNASTRINLRSVSEGKINSLISPPLDFSNIASADANMTFQMAHANRTSDSHGERLRVYASKNCGETWTLRYTKTGDNLNTAGGFESSTFIPEDDEWEEESVSLSAMAGESHVLIKFETLSDKQSYLYLDDINITPNAGVGISDKEIVQSAVVYPNPITSESFIELGLAENTDVSIEIVNVIGQSLGTKHYNLTSGANKISISEVAHLHTLGVYFILIKTDSGTKTLKLINNQ